jgi:hypothetical protein
MFIRLIEDGFIIKVAEGFYDIDTEHFKSFNATEYRKELNERKNKLISLRAKERWCNYSAEEHKKIRSKISEKTTKVMNTPEMHNKVSSINKANASKISNTVKKDWETMSEEAYSTRCSNISKGLANMSIEKKQIMIETMRDSLKLKYQDEHYLELHRQRVKDSMTIEIRQKISERTKKAMARPEVYKKVCEANRNNASKIAESTRLHWTEEERLKQHFRCQEASNKLFDNPVRKQEILEQQWETKKKNGTTNTSKPEQLAYKILTDLGLKVHNSYRSEMYPFNCDLYIEDINLYIELHYTWTHGGEPYDKDNIKHQQWLKDWEEKSKTSDYYKKAINTWTITDPYKLSLAIKNNLNYLCFYSEDDFNAWLATISN